MKSSHKPIGIDEANRPLNLKEKIIFWAILATPLFIMGGVDLMGKYQEKHSEPPKRPDFVYPRKDLNFDIPAITPKIKPGDRLMPDQNYSGVVLEINGMKVYTGLSSEEILNELSLDYQDLFDYYGGAEELY